MQEVDYKTVVPLDLSKVPFKYLEIEPKETFCGIYAYYCTGNSKFYIGSTKNFIKTKFQRGRKEAHLKELKAKRHHSPTLRYAFNKYGIDNFFWFKLEECSEENLFSVENNYLQRYKPFQSDIGFNINDKAGGGTPEHLLPSYKFVNFDGKIFEGRNLTRFARENSCHARFLRELRDGKRIFYKNFISYDNVCDLEKIKLEASNVGYFKLISPEGVIIEGTDRESFCNKHNFKRQYLIDLITGKADTLHGWRKFIEGKHPNRTLTTDELKGLDEEVEVKRLKNSKEWEFIFNGKLVKIYNLNKFCKENGLGHNLMINANRGLRDTPYKGYSSPDPEISKKQWDTYNKRRCNKRYESVSS